MHDTRYGENRIFYSSTQALPGLGMPVQVWSLTYGPSSPAQYNDELFARIRANIYNYR